jgi:hypothetical protein
MWLLVYMNMNIFVSKSKKIPDFRCISVLRFNFGCGKQKKNFVCVSVQ